MLVDALEQPRVKGAQLLKPASECAEIVVAGRHLRPTEVFDTYWTFASRRQRIYSARINGVSGPWTDDPILREHRFTNCYRAADRVSQYLISNVIYSGSQAFDEVVFRTLLFKLFNKIETWELLLDGLGETPSWHGFDLDTYDDLLSRSFEAGIRIYSAAYVMAPPRLGAERKHTNHLRLLRDIMVEDLPGALTASASMKDAFAVLRAQPGIGDFLAFQYLIDLNYSAGLDFDEMDYVVAGPGAKDGIRKCFGRAAAGIEAEVIAYMAETQAHHFERLGLSFDGLHGRPLQLIDCQNLFCEVDKYARVAHPTVPGLSGRTRIKQRFTPRTEPLTTWFPPKWGLRAP
ncbi:nucleotide kinase domain-containing protein [Nocardioides caricicola]|uniref:Nucleotide kinase domain-containing protein n=1 Tax=Nocardioides caricicola TaxID=634770 RepID=A0ABW0MZ58_9ACTN